MLPLFKRYFSQFERLLQSLTLLLSYFEVFHIICLKAQLICFLIFILRDSIQYTEYRCYFLL